MSEIFSYQTVISAKEPVLYKDKGSKFWGYIFGLEKEEEVDKFLKKVQQEHPKARHHCYAYTIGIEQKKSRTHDDGEPSNSAGMPIYNQILSHQLDNVLIVVVRYFGGTKLGVSGLIRAYKSSAELSIEATQVITIERVFRAKILCTYQQLSSVYHYLNTHPCTIIDQKMEIQCMLKVEFPLKNKKEVLDFYKDQPYEFSLLDEDSYLK